MIDRQVYEYNPVCIEIALWRARVGTFSQPIKCRTALPVLRITGVLLGVRVLLFLLLAVNGVETNPGPLAGSGVHDKGKGKGGSTTAAGRGHSNVGETNQRLLRSNSSSTQGGAHGGAQGVHTGMGCDLLRRTFRHIRPQRVFSRR